MEALLKSAIVLLFMCIIITLALVIVVGVYAFSGLLLFLAENQLAPVFHWPALTYLQSCAVAFLIAFVTGNAVSSVKNLYVAVVKGKEALDKIS